ncbi:hypothetical protein cyc_06794 [Cyclospora cayetanensis]|uniref:Uncharacterized protein n=1 Tax=Cyclospora cayetanensis TaxID=88456 RepID=A0A1D3CU75_9EIME|nr:hypothetical protein cyc_06794 [Cyclospora cayetanensis]
MNSIDGGRSPRHIQSRLCINLHKAPRKRGESGPKGPQGAPGVSPEIPGAPDRRGGGAGWEFYVAFGWLVLGSQVGSLPSIHSPDEGLPRIANIPFRSVFVGWKASRRRILSALYVQQAAEIPSKYLLVVECPRSCWLGASSPAVTCSLGAPNAKHAPGPLSCLLLDPGPQQP